MTNGLVEPTNFSTDTVGADSLLEEAVRSELVSDLKIPC
jgi:hypothetical protein